MLRPRSLVAAGLSLVIACGDGGAGENISGIDPISIASVQLSPRVDTIFVADTMQARDTVHLKAVAMARTGGPIPNVRFAWTSSDSTVAVPDANGVVRAVGVGTAEIKASVGKSATTTIVVAAAARTVYVGADVASATGTILVDDPIKPADTLRLRAEARDESGEVVPGVSWTWSTSNASVAAVDASGMVSASGLGQATISASTSDMGGEVISDSYVITVAPLVQSVNVGALPARLVVGDTVVMTAVTHGPDDQELTGRTYRWESSNAGVATVDDTTGRVVVRAPGSFAITATTGFVRGTAPVAGSTAASAVEVLPRVFTSIAAGEDYTCGTISLNRLYCWGKESAQTLAAPQIGDTTCVNKFGVGGTILPCTLVPKRSAAPLAISSISTGRDHVCAVASDSRGYCWGVGASNGNGKTGGSKAPELVTSALTFASVSAGDDHSCALTAEGAAWCWGSDSLGQLGNAKPAFSTTPIPVDGGGTYAVISAGYRHTCAVLTSGGLQCWGGNESGQLGIGTRDSSSTPRDVAPGTTFRTVVASNTTTCALTSAGAAYCWGEGSSGQIGNGGTADALTPQPVAGGRTFSQIVVGDQHACGLQDDGRVYCWGRYNLGAYSEPAVLVPTQLATAHRFTSIAAGFRHACGLTAEGTVWCWGSNVWGAFGDGLQALWRPVPLLRVETPATSR